MSRLERGIDVSHHNGIVDWSRVAAAGYRFAFAKATEGTSYRDATLATNVLNARKAGLLVGAYHFGRPKLDPAAQVAHFAETVRRVGPLDFAPVLDLEVADGLGEAQVRAWAARFVETATVAFGRRPVLYTGAYFLNGALDGNDFGCPRWIARYNTEPPKMRWDIWQHTSDAAVPGVAGRCDENLCTTETLNRLAGAGGAAPQPQGEDDVAHPPLPIAKEGVGALFVPGDGIATALHDLKELVPLYDAGLLARSGIDHNGKVITHATLPADLFDRLYPKVTS